MSFTATELNGSKVEQYQQLTEQARGLVFEEPNLIANAANLSALVYHALPESIGSVSTCTTAPNWWSGRFRVSLPACASP